RPRKTSCRPGSRMSPACLATYLTWLQAGRLKSPRDKSCSYSATAFPSRRPSDNPVKDVCLKSQVKVAANEDQDVSFTLAPGAHGILPDRMIAAMADSGLILPEYPFVESQIQPASLDLRLGDIAYRVRASFLPGPGATVAERIDELKLHEISLSDGAVLETNCVYIVPLIESLALPKQIVASANPKSSTGRLDVFTRVIADGTRRFDMIGAGYHGPLYAEISPKTFPVLLREGSRLSQVRFRTGEATLNAGELDALHEKERLVDIKDADLTGGVALSVDLSGKNSGGFVGYRAKRHTGVVDVDRRGGYAIDDFWEPIRARE